MPQTNLHAVEKDARCKGSVHRTLFNRTVDEMFDEKVDYKVNFPPKSLLH